LPFNPIYAATPLPVYELLLCFFFRQCYNYFRFVVCMHVCVFFKKIFVIISLCVTCCILTTAMTDAAFLRRSMCLVVRMAHELHSL